MIEIPNVDDLETNLSYEFILKNKKNVKIIDIGVGSGVALKYIPNDSIYYGIDKNLKYINRISKKNNQKNINFYQQNISKKLDRSLKKKFDICIASHIIEHIDPIYLDRFIKNLIGTLKKFKKSELWIVTPNKDVINKFNPKPTNPYHLKEYNLNELKKIIKTYKFQATIFGQLNNNNKKFEDLRSKKVKFINYFLSNKFIRVQLSLIIPKKIREKLTDLIITRSKKSDYKIIKKDLEKAENFILRIKPYLNY